MSQAAPNQSFPRTRVPRIADAAVERARLTVVPRRRGRAPRVPFVALVSLLLVGGVVGLLLFNTSMQQRSFTATALEQQAQILAAQEQSLEMELETLRDPQRVALEARSIGMVPPANPAFIRLSDGRVLGTPTAAVPEDGIRISPLPTRKPKNLRPDAVVVAAPETVTDSAPESAVDGAAGQGGAASDDTASEAHGGHDGTNEQQDRAGRTAGQQGTGR
jgi:cell division protein FtsB